MTEDFFMQMQEAVYQAGDLIKDVTSIDELKYKEGPANFVTKYDSEVQAFLMDRLHSLCPEAGFLCEEDGYADTPVSEGYAFIIDPIDGTTNFISGFRLSAVCAALTENGRAKMSFVYNPFTGEMFSACRGEGARLNGRPLHVKATSLKDGVTICGMAPYNPECRDKYFPLIREITTHTMDIRELGSAALGVSYVACGRSAAYISPLLCPWDYAAAALIAEESGALCCDWQGRKPDYSGKTNFIAAPPEAVREFKDILKEMNFR